MAARPQFNSKSPTIKRILREASELNTAPSADYTASPASDENLFDWHFTLRGPPTSAFSEGIYHGRIVLPPTYPLRPPSFRFLTPSGRFETNREICLSISGHHEETWQPAWGIRTALVALRSFMETDPAGQLGGIESSEQVRKRFADESKGWKCSSCGKANWEILKECADAAKTMEEEGQEKREDVVPSELKLGYKDELGKEKFSPNDSVRDTTPELAEGFVQTARVVPLTPPDGPSNTYPSARPAQGVPQPTGAIAPVPVAAPARLAMQPQLAQHPPSNAGVPVWVDRAIVGVVFCLVFMIFRVLFAV